MDLTVPDEACRVMFRYEDFQMWESKIYGFINMFKGEYIILNQFGMRVVGFTGDKIREIADDKGNKRMLRKL